MFVGVIITLTIIIAIFLVIIQIEERKGKKFINSLDCLAILLSKEFPP